MRIADLGSVTTWSDTGTVGGTTYTHTVSAENGTREGPLSNQATATARSPPTRSSVFQQLETGRGRYHSAR